MSADLVLLDAKIITMNPAQPTADAVAVTGDKIIQVGSIETVSKTIGKNTKILNLKGKTVIPGIIDTHIHVADFGRILSWLNLEGVPSIKELQNRLCQRVKETPAGKWIVGRGWDEKCFAEKQCLTRVDLDKVSPDNPVVLYHASGQVCVVNSRASELAGISKQTGNGIERNPMGEFTGILKDEATNAVWNVIPAPDEEDMVSAATLALQQIAQAGITSIHWLPLLPNEIKVIQKLNEQNKLPIRVNVIAPASFFSEISKFASEQNSEGGLLRFGGFEIFADGYLASRTAALFEPYSDYPSEKGALLYPQKEMAALAYKIVADGFQIVIHAVGDKAVDVALNVIEQAIVKAGKGLRCRVEQAAVLNENLIVRLRKQGAVVSIQPRVVSSEFSVWSAMNHLGAERAKWLFPLKRMVDAGVAVAAGSDCPMEPLNPMLGIQDAVTREAFPQQRVSAEEALRMYTVNAAWASGEENVKGSIEPGKLADLTVLSDDPKAVEPSKISEIKIEMAFVGGRGILLNWA